jgi:membrane protein
LLRELAALELRRLSWARVKRAVAAIAKEFTEYDLLTYSSAISFQVLYAVLPLSLLALAGLGVLHLQSIYTDHIAPSLKSTLSADAFRIADRTANHVMNGKRFWWTTVGLVVCLWGAGAALRSMMTPLNRVYGSDEDRSWLRRIAVSIGGGALGIVCLGGALLIALLAPLWNLHGVVGWLFWIVRWLATIGLVMAAIATILRVVPAKKRPFEWISLGSALCTVCWVVATLGFGAYITAVSYASFYGAVAGLVLLLVYVHVATIAFLLGVVVDSLLREVVTDRGRRSRPSSRRRSGSRPRRTARGSRG